MTFRATVWVFPPLEETASHVYAVAHEEKMQRAELFCRKRMAEGALAHPEHKFSCSVISDHAIAAYAASPQTQRQKRLDQQRLSRRRGAG